MTPDGKIYNGDSITVTFTLVHKEDIKDVKVDDLKTAVDSEKNFGDLNTNKEITDAVAVTVKFIWLLPLKTGIIFIGLNFDTLGIVYIINSLKS